MAEKNGKVLAGCVKTSEAGVIRFSAECHLKVGDKLEIAGISRTLEIKAMALNRNPIKRVTRRGVVVEVNVNGPVSQLNRVTRGAQVFRIPESPGGL
ncbi:MAG: hypothetical protein ABIH38_03795 [Patescibacteria group bacterium]